MLKKQHSDQNEPNQRQSWICFKAQIFKVHIAVIFPFPQNIVLIPFMVMSTLVSRVRLMRYESIINN